MSMWQWLMMAGGFIALELLTPMFFFWFLALAALELALVVMFWEMNWQGQALSFACLALINGLLWRKIGRSQSQAIDEADLLNHRGLALVSKRFVLQSAIENGRGRLQIGDTLWQLECEQSALAEGTLIEVIGDVGGRLQVKRVNHA
ncbi:MAG: NfeD family protein [Cardiobacteriaceae bacterium]|nr:NfeD family protein [Cardiobacteriaceae bacterium]